MVAKSVTKIIKTINENSVVPFKLFYQEEL